MTRFHKETLTPVPGVTPAPESRSKTRSLPRRKAGGVFFVSCIPLGRESEGTFTSLATFGNRKLLLNTFVLGILSVPLFARAQTITDLLDNAVILVRVLIPVAFGVAVAIFFWGVAKYIYAAGDEKKKEGRNIITAGIIGLFVISAIWGIVAFIGSELGIGAESSIDLLQVCAAGAPTTFQQLLCRLDSIVLSAVPLVVGLIVLIFFWGVARYIAGGKISIGEGTNKKETEGGRNMIVWGIIALFVVFTIWGIVRFIASDLGILSDPNLLHILPEGQ